MFNKGIILEQRLDITCPKCSNNFTKTFREWTSGIEHELVCSCGQEFTLDTTELKSALDGFLDFVNTFSEKLKFHARALRKS